MRLVGALVMVEPKPIVLVTGPRPKGGNRGDKGLPFKLRSVSEQS